MPNIKQLLKKWTKSLPKWQNFAKSGHTDGGDPTQLLAQLLPPLQVSYVPSFGLFVIMAFPLLAAFLPRVQNT